MGNASVRTTVVAKRGESSYLIMVGDDADTADGIVVSVRHHERFPPRPLQAILARGYWEPHKHDPKLLRELFAIPEREDIEQRGEPKEEE